MKISVDWLNRYLDAPADADAIDRLLTDQGLPIESRLAVEGGDGDIVLDVEVTSNRSDCLSHLGLAREVAAGLERSVVAPDTSMPTGTAVNEVDSLTSVDVQEPELCPVYTARVIRGVKVGPSPDWLVARLKSVGLRSVNNVVDVTNFVLMELGQPLHAFDLDRLAGQRIVVRRAQEGQGMVAIDGSPHRLDASMLVIADADKPVAIAGVMGGQETAVTDQTQNVLLESAIFDPSCVRRTSRALKLASDSSYRFERGVDPVGVELASRRAARLIGEVAGGTLAAGVLRVGDHEPGPRPVTLRTDRCNALLGLQLPASRMVKLLDRLRFEPRLDDAAGKITCRVPSYRLDVNREVDLIEEIARLHGFDPIPINETIRIVARPVQPAVAARQKLAEVLVAHGYHEAVTFSYVEPRLAQPFLWPDQQSVMIDHASRHVGTRAEPALRPSVLPSLLACRKSNQDVGNAPVHLFEAAAVWTGQDGAIHEHNRLAMLCDADDPQHSLRRVRGTIGELVEQMSGRCELSFVPAERPSFSDALMVSLGGHQLGWLGLIDRACTRLFELQAPVVGAELDLDGLLKLYPPQHDIRPLPKFPRIGRDLSVVVAEKVRWDEIQDQVLASGPRLLEDIAFIGVYRGKPIPRGEKSVSFRLLFRDPQATLRHEEVDPQIAAVVERLDIQLGARLRG